MLAVLWTYIFIPLNNMLILAIYYKKDLDPLINIIREIYYKLISREMIYI